MENMYKFHTFEKRTTLKITAEIDSSLHMVLFKGSVELKLSFIEVYVMLFGFWTVIKHTFGESVSRGWKQATVYGLITADEPEGKNARSKLTLLALQG